MGIDLGLARQQLQGKKKKEFKRKMKEKNARKSARRRGIKQRGPAAEEPKSIFSSNTVFFGTLAIILFTAIYVVPSIFKADDDRSSISLDTGQPTAVSAKSTVVNSAKPRQQAASSGVATAGGSALPPPTTVNENLFIDVEVVTTLAGVVQDAAYYQLEDSLGVKTITRTSNTLDNFGLPALEINIQNNGDTTVYLSELNFSAIKSGPSITPEFLVSSEINLNDPEEKFIVIENDGWGTVKSSLLNGTLVRSGTSQTIQDIVIGEFEGSAKIDASALLSNVFGISTPQLGEEILFSGSLKYDYYGADGTEVPGTQEIECRLLNKDVQEKPANNDVTINPESIAKRAIFEADKQDYSVQTRILNTIKPGEEGSILVVIGAVKSSLHQFELDLQYNRSQQVNLGQFNLNYHLPRSKNRKINEILP